MKNQCNSAQHRVVHAAAHRQTPPPGNIANMVSAGFKTLALPSSAFAPTLAKLQQSNRLEVRGALQFLSSSAVSSLLIYEYK